jgi:hypothetical protein
MTAEQLKDLQRAEKRAKKEAKKAAKKVRLKRGSGPASK